MSQGTIPSAVNGGIVVTTLPAPSGVTNAYVPPSSFTVSSQLFFYGANCAATRFDPQQLNAFESEMLCLAATMAPNGTWNTGSVCNLASAFQTWAQAITSGSLSLSAASAYPSSAASNTTAATPAYVAAAISAAVGAGISLAPSSSYPADVSLNSVAATPAYVAAAIAAAIVPASSYPGDIASTAQAASPAYVEAAITAIVTAAVTAAESAVESTVEAMIPTLTKVASYPSSSDTTAATPAFVDAACAAVSSAAVALDTASNYPDSTNNTKAATPGYVNSAVNAGIATAEAFVTSAIEGIPGLSNAATYPANNANDTTGATPAFVTAAITAAKTVVEALIPALAVSGDYPSDDASDILATTPAYVAAAIAASGGGGGGGGGGGVIAVAPSIVQYNVGVGTYNALTMTSAPVAGNILIAFVTSPSALVAASGWEEGATNAPGLDYAGIFYKVAAVSESTTQQPIVSANANTAIGIYEIANGNIGLLTVAGLNSWANDQSTTTPVTPPCLMNDGSLLLFAFPGTAVGTPTLSSGTLDDETNNGSREIAIGHNTTVAGINQITATFGTTGITKASFVCIEPIVVATSVPITVTDQTGTTYTFALTDGQTMVEYNNAAAGTFTIPPHSSVAFPVGTYIREFQGGAGPLTIAPGAGVTLLYAANVYGATSRSKNSVLQITQVSTDVWLLEGDTTGQVCFGGKPPVVVQTGTAQGVGSDPSVTMGSGPVDGNLLVAAVFNTGTNPSTGSGWTMVGSNYVGGVGVTIFTKTAGVSESTTQSPSTAATGDVSTIVWEVSGALSGIEYFANGTVSSTVLSAAIPALPVVPSSLFLAAMALNSASTPIATNYGLAFSDLLGSSGAQAVYGHSDSTNVQSFGLAATWTSLQEFGYTGIIIK